VRAYSGASVAVNIHHTAGGNGADEAFLNQRLFEVAAIGVPQVVDYRGDLPQHFEPGRDVLVFHDADELRRSVRALLQDPAASTELGNAGRRQALTRHTYMHRLKQVLEGLAPGG
jgi:spore maturation protein CgeB